MENVCIQRAAKRLRKRYGDNAAILSNRRADEFLDLGNLDRFSAWAGIAQAVIELDKMCPHKWM